MIKIAIIGVGSVGTAFLKLLNYKKELLKKEGLEFIVTYIMNSKRGMYKEDGFILKKSWWIITKKRYWFLNRNDTYK